MLRLPLKLAFDHHHPTTSREFPQRSEFCGLDAPKRKGGRTGLTYASDISISVAEEVEPADEQPEAPPPPLEPVPEGGGVKGELGEHRRRGHHSKRGDCA
eukprot:3234850-Prorocentrum_lima.AAC.1